MRYALSLLLVAVWAISAQAAPQAYLLEPDRSVVAFSWHLGPDELQGQMPVLRADLNIDFARPANSQVNVTLDVARARAGFLFATQAMKGPKVLDARHYPQITFVSTGVRVDGDGALIDGDINIRGITRPITLRAQFYRQSGTEAGDLSRLSILLSGSVLRSDFGATGWPDMVGDEIGLRILARIRFAELG